MNAVGIDVSKGKSMMAARRPMGEIVLLPKEYPHTEVGLERLALDILALGEETRVLMEATAELFCSYCVPPDLPGKQKRTLFQASLE